LFLAIPLALSFACARAGGVQMRLSDIYLMAKTGLIEGGDDLIFTDVVAFVDEDLLHPPGDLRGDSSQRIGCYRAGPFHFSGHVALVHSDHRYARWQQHSESQQHHDGNQDEQGNPDTQVTPGTLMSRWSQASRTRRLCGFFG